MYNYVCYTCEENDLFRDRESAQAAFNDHAERRHEVVLKRIESSEEEVISTLGEDAGPAESSIPNSGTEGSDPVG